MTAPRSRTIAFVLSSLHFGGAERVALNLADALKAQGYQIEFVLMQAAGEFLPRAHRDHRVVDLRCDRTWKLPLKLARYLRRYRPVAVIASFWKLNICLAAARIAAPRTRVALWEHSSPQAEGNSPTWAFAPTASLLYRLATCVITVSRSVGADIAKRSVGLRRKLVTINNAIPAPFLSRPVTRDSDPAVRQLVWVGRFSEIKNAGLMLRAFAALPAGETQYRLRLIGDGPLRSEIEQLATALGIADRIDFTGFTDDPYPQMTAADLLVLSSILEGLPTVVVEALYLGVNIVSTDCGAGVHDILEGGRFGTIVPNDDPDALATGIVQRLAEPIESATLRQAALRYDPQAIAGQVLRALRLSARN